MRRMFTGYLCDAPFGSSQTKLPKKAFTQWRCPPLRIEGRKQGCWWSRRGLGALQTQAHLLRVVSGGGQRLQLARPCSLEPAPSLDPGGGRPWARGLLFHHHECHVSPVMCGIRPRRPSSAALPQVFFPKRFFFFFHFLWPLHNILISNNCKGRVEVEG